MQICIPANIRWQLYEKFEDVKLENKFAPVALSIPICANPEDAIQKTKPVTRQLKGSFPQIYATYVLSLIVGFCIPTFMSRFMANNMSQPFTLAFSNTPGCLKPLHYAGMEVDHIVPAMLCSGKCGVSVAMLSHCNFLKFSVMCDTSINSEPHKIKGQIEAAVERLIEYSKQPETKERRNSIHEMQK